MGKKYTRMFYGEKIYLDDIKALEKGVLSDGQYWITVNYISDYFRSIGDPDPRFQMHLYYDKKEEGKMERDFYKLRDRLVENQYGCL